MIASEPSRTAYDLNFVLFGVPIRVHPFFWLMALLFSAMSPDTPPQVALLGMGAIFVSILVHELGHCAAFRYYGESSHIVLHGFGGLAIPDGRYSGGDYSFGRGRGLTHGAQILISLAGPMAGFLFAALIVAGVYTSGHSVYLSYYFDGFQVGDGPDLRGYLGVLVFILLYVNIAWGLINLLPVYPLDGGQMFRSILTIFNPHEGVRQSLILSVMTGAGMAIIFLVRFEALYPALLFGYLAYVSYSSLQGMYGSGPRW